MIVMKNRDEQFDMPDYKVVVTYAGSEVEVRLPNSIDEYNNYVSGKVSPNTFTGRILALSDTTFNTRITDEVTYSNKYITNVDYELEYLTCITGVTILDLDDTHIPEMYRQGLLIPNVFANLDNNTARQYMFKDPSEEVLLEHFIKEGIIEADTERYGDVVDKYTDKQSDEANAILDERLKTILRKAPIDNIKKILAERGYYGLRKKDA